ncbi:MAG: cell division protein FtsZ [Bifidobacteriaceae bacterium]|jgi:cell division protein FtsZ|nr:cell division protein FtsZ [Bifidobacteriaceae bacterium]
MTEDLGNVPIKVFGIGGGGVNAINTMIQSGLTGVEFIAANTDAQNLMISEADIKLNIGVELSAGEGIGGDPEKGRQATEAHADEIKKTLEGARLVLITTGEGGGTGSGGAPVVAKISKDMGILTIGVVTTPFSLELEQRMNVARKGVEELRKEVDALMVISNDKLLTLGDDTLDYDSGLKMADNILHTCVEAVTEVIHKHYTPNIDFRDIDRISRSIGTLLIGIGKASGDDRGAKAVINALESPLLDDKISQATGVVVGIQSSNNFLMTEITDLVKPIQRILKKDAWFKFGRAVDDSLGDEVKVIIIASGFQSDVKPFSAEFNAIESSLNSNNIPATETTNSAMPSNSQSVVFSQSTPSIPNMTGSINIVGAEHKKLDVETATEAIEIPNSQSNKTVNQMSPKTNVNSSSLNIPPFLSDLDKE